MFFIFDTEILKLKADNYTFYVNFLDIVKF